MQLPLQDFATLVKTQVAAVSASCRQLLDISIGSVLRALLEANASVGLWIQWLIVEVLATTRAATSTGADLDSWVADFGMARLPASPSAGQVRFSRTTSGLATVVPVGALVRTGLDVSDQVYVVSADTSNPAWTGAGYLVAANDSGVSTPVVAQTSGIAGNVQPGAIRQLASAIPGIDSVTNDGPMLGGLDAETDDALRMRFAGFLDSRTRATAQAVGFAIASIRQGLSYTIAERVDAAGAVRPGHFTVTIDDGTGSPPAALIAQVASAIDAVRPIGGTFSVRPPLVLPADVEMRVAGTSEARAAVRVAVLEFVSSLPIGAPLIISRLYQVAHDASSSVTSVSGVTINGAAADLTPPLFGLIRPSVVGVTA
jgi:uncharacterized phage protein gp47/JayE